MDLEKIVLNKITMMTGIKEIKGLTGFKCRNINKIEEMKEKGIDKIAGNPQSIELQMIDR